MLVSPTLGIHRRKQELFRSWFRNSLRFLKSNFNHFEKDCSDLGHCKTVGNTDYSCVWSFHCSWAKEKSWMLKISKFTDWHHRTKPSKKFCFWKPQIFNLQHCGLFFGSTIEITYDNPTTYHGLIKIQEIAIYGL